MFRPFSRACLDLFFQTRCCLLSFSNVEQCNSYLEIRECIAAALPRVSREISSVSPDPRMIRATVNLRMPGGKETFGDEMDIDSDTSNSDGC
jgi:hypothetical protein